MTSKIESSKNQDPCWQVLSTWQSEGAGSRVARGGCSLGIRRLYFFHRRRRRIHSRLFYFPLFTGRKTRRPIQLLAFGMGSYQGVGTQLEKVAAIFESEFSNYPFE